MFLLTVTVLLVSLQRVSVVLLPACEVRKKSVVRVRVGVRLVVVAGRRVRLVVMMLFVFALLVPLLAARSLLRLRHG